MREILFKAKRIGNGGWVEGIPIKTHLGLFISFEKNPNYCSQYGYIEIVDIGIVEEETLCQFTGMCDKNGNKIWENDIVTCQTKYGGDIGKIVFHNGKFCVLWNSTYHYPRNGKCENYYDINTKNLVKGNIFDNPELLKGC